MTDGVDRPRPGDVRRWTWPAGLIGGLLLVALSLVPWGVSDQGVKPSVTGLGRVSVPGAAPEDVAFLEDLTRRPGLVTVIVGVVIAIAAALAWWRSELRWPAVVVVGVGAVVALVVAVVTLSDPGKHLFESRVTDAVDSDTPIISVGYGLVGVLVVSVVLIGLMMSTVIVGRDGTADAGPQTDVANRSDGSS
ncbi:hypothetical protein GTV32_11255 [Gordonia sp. SID5947]|uniref:hypothetical protein n=1 Tax=Gordonia sp. SID5947 TaxID=2690315 RepID=UPI00136B34B2|nr:hypothetical protein [Gordonia sp. SID5947]MYR06846.1 hypothetical protein [Gordonia sp. SID5947]